MKRIILICFILAIVTFSCEKNVLDLEKPILKGVTLPYEDDNLRIELLSATGPGNARAIQFFNADEGIAATYYGEIYMTSDSGKTWALKFKNPVNDQPFYQVYFTDRNTGYVVGGSLSYNGAGCIPPGGLVMKTSDGGETWTKIYQLKKAEIVAVSSNSLGDLFIIANGTKSWISRSTDQGSDWTMVDSTAFRLNQITFKGDIGFCTGKDGIILRSSSNSNSWEKVAAIDAIYTTDIGFNNQAGYCLANNMSVYKTTNNGAAWSKVCNLDGPFYGLKLLSGNNWLLYGSGGYTGGCFGTFYAGFVVSENSGTTWGIIPVLNVPAILSVSFYSEKEGYAIAGYNKGSVLKIRLK
jgi:photosystem II stability/assembly factor-like uncharacterized protein